MIQNRRIFIIDVLRLIAVSLVVLFHFFPDKFYFGFIGVDIFFVISGYVIALSIQKSDVNGYVFFKKRFFRLFPVLFIVCIVVLMVFAFNYDDSLLKTLFTSFITSLGSLSNIYYGQVSGYFDLVSEINPFLHTWSLSIEWQFYLLLSILLFLTKNANQITKTVFLLSILSLFYSVYFQDVRPTLNFYFIASRFYEFGMGYLFLTYKPVFSKHIRLLQISSLLLLFYLIGYGDFSGKTWPNFTATILCVLTVIIIISCSNVRKVGKSGQLIEWISDRSYSIYLVHFPFAAYMKYYNVDSNWMKFILIIIVVLVSNVTYIYIEKKYRYYWNHKKANLISCLFFIFIFMSLTLLTLTTQSSSTTHADYVQENFNELLGTEASKSAVYYVAGDSYAQDFTNVLIDGLEIPKSEISTFFIDMSCGNLLLKYSERDKQTGQVSCPSFKEYSDYLEKIPSDGALILASNWEPWVLLNLKTSLDNIREIYKGKILVIGNKHIGKQNPYYLNGLNPELRTKLTSSPPNYIKDINVSLQEIVKDDDDILFIDVQSYLLNADGTADVTNDEGEIISYDGGHLTKFGAILIGKQLEKYFSND